MESNTLSIFLECYLVHTPTLVFYPPKYPLYRYRLVYTFLFSQWCFQQYLFPKNDMDDRRIYEHSTVGRLTDAVCFRAHYRLLWILQPGQGAY